MDQIQFHDLPNEVILMILDYLSTMQLLLIKEVCIKLYHLSKLVSQRIRIPILYKTIKFEYIIDAIFYRRGYLVIYNRNQDKFFITNYDLKIIYDVESGQMLPKKHDQYRLSNYAIDTIITNRDYKDIYEFRFLKSSFKMSLYKSVTILSDSEFVSVSLNSITVKRIENSWYSYTDILAPNGTINWNTDIPVAYDSKNNIYIAAGGQITKVSINNHRNSTSKYDYGTDKQLPYDNNNLVICTGRSIYWIVMDKIDRLFVCVGEIQVYNTDGILLFEFGKGFSSKTIIIFDNLNNPIVIDGNQVYFYYA